MEPLIIRTPLARNPPNTESAECAIDWQLQGTEVASDTAAAAAAAAALAVTGMPVCAQGPTDSDAHGRPRLSPGSLESEERRDSTARPLNRAFVPR